MKIKGINPLEQHVEKIVLALAGAGLLAVLALQFVGGGTEINVGNEATTIEGAYEDAAQEAERLLARIRSNQVAEEVPTEAPNLARDYQERMTEPVVDRVAMAAPLGQPIGDIVLDGPVVDQLIVDLPQPPAPMRPVSRSFGGAIDPLVVAAVEDIRVAAPYMPEEQPFDLRAVSVESSFNASEFAEMLEADPDGPNGPAQPVPLIWWQEHLEVLDVVLERQELYADGGESGVTVIAPLPGRFSVRDRLSAIETRPEMIGVKDAARAEVREIMIPRFWRMIAGDRWTPPSVSDEGDSEQAEIRRLRAQAERLREEIEDLQQRLRGDQRGRADDREWLRNVYAQRERGPGRQGQQREQPSADERRRQQIAAQIEQKQTQLAEIETRLVDLGAMPQEDETIVDPVAAAYAEPLLRLRDANELRLWAHDPSVRPGATYRYRVRVVFSNPLFGLDENLAEQSREQAASSTITSPPSPWSSPVTVDENAYLFLTNASVDEVLGGQRELARFELYRFYYGYWRRATRTLSPGDAVTGALDLEALNLPVFEIGMSEEGVPMVEERSVQEGAFPFAAEGWFLLDVTRAPTRGGGLAGREVYQAVLRSPGGGLEAILPGEGDEGGVRTRLADSADAASGATIREPSLAEAALRTPERREQPDRSLGGGTRRER